MTISNIQYTSESRRGVKQSEVPLVKAELEKIRAKHGYLDPEIVLECARSPNHPLHRFFNWNDKEAAEAHRLEQARNLCRAVQVVITYDSGQKQKLTAHVSIKTESRKQYVPVLEALSEKELRAKVIQSFYDEAMAFLRRYETVKEVSGVVNQIKKLISKLRKTK